MLTFPSVPLKAFMLNRRTFVASSLAALIQQVPPAPTTRPNLAQIDRTRILAAASKALAETPKPTQDSASDAWLAFTLDLPALAAATLVDPADNERYTTHAAALLDAWLLNPTTRLVSKPQGDTYEPLLERAALAEVAVAITFLKLDSILLSDLKHWFHDYLAYLTENRTALLARDAKNHHASSWLLQTSAMARLLADEAILADTRHRFKASTLRAQVDANGMFPHELSTANPLRDSLFNLDLLAGAVNLLSTRFESLWDYELQDGPGMRSAIARFAVYIRNRAVWPYPADQSHFNQLPGRRPALVFAGRAFAVPDYVTLWSTLNPDPTDPAILRTFPIRQPILWLTQPKPNNV